MEAIVIVGGGPVGLTLSLVLARYQVSALVLEAREEPTSRNESRAITWMPKGLELLDWLELGESFDRIGVRRVAHEFWSGERRLLRMPFDEVRSPHRYTLQLPQHDSEVLLERAALQTGMVEIRRGHRVVRVSQEDNRAHMGVEGPDGTYDLATPYAVGCDGAGSTVKRMLGIETSWRNYGTYSAVADFEMDCNLPKEVSRILLDPSRPYSFFYFALGRWRFIYRINEGEDRRAMTTEDAATELLERKLPDAQVHRFLWASAFRLGQGQSETYHKGRWLLCGDAAHAMGPSAGAGMMVGVLGAWRLGWRLALAAKGDPHAEELLARYEREQRAGSEEVQNANATIFRNMAVNNRLVGTARSAALRGLSYAKPMVRRMTEKEALVTQRSSFASSNGVRESAASGRGRVGSKLSRGRRTSR
jgi:2-polyprenyl-6-methoxyphenol hydroxylase-like FAD-dependent oxidoreductase